MRAARSSWSIIRITGLLLLISALAFPIHLPTEAQQPQSKQEKLENIKDIILSHYVDEVDPASLENKTIDTVFDDLDLFSNYFPTETFARMQEQYRGDFAGVGFSFDIFDGVITVLQALSGSDAERVGLQPGDQITRVNGGPILAGLSDQELADWAYEHIRGPVGSTVELTIRHADGIRYSDYVLTRKRIPVASVSVTTMLNDVTGYVRLISFTDSSANEVRQAFEKLQQQGARNFVLDLRGNPGGRLVAAIDIADLFLSKNTPIVEMRGRTVNRTRSSRSPEHFRGVPLIIMVNEQSASASEVLSGALQDWDRALITGERTYGKAFVQNQFKFPDGSAIMLTIARYYTPTGRLIQRDHDDNGRPIGTSGGIIPNEETVGPRYANVALFLSFENWAFHFVLEYTRAGGQIPTTQEDFASFSVDDAMLQEFIEFLAQHDVYRHTDTQPYTPQEILDLFNNIDEEMQKSAASDVRLFLKMGIAEFLWRQEAGRHIILQQDNGVAEALQHMSKAAKLIGQ